MSMKVLGTGRARRPISQRVDTEEPSSYGGVNRTSHWKTVGYESGDIAVLVDPDLILYRLGQKALGNKTGKARALKGAIVVKVTKRYPIEEVQP